MKSIRVLITDKCNASCPNCLNKKFRTESQLMDVQKFDAIAHYFHDNGVKRIRLMGGEPSIHPNFGQIAALSQSLYERVTVFSNGLNRNLLKFKPREYDGINYNAKFASHLSEELLMDELPGSRLLSVVIDRHLIVDVMKHHIERLTKIVDRLKVSLTFDCTTNIFRARRLLLEKFDALYAFCEKMDIEVTIDHGLPVCFLYGSKVPTFEGFSMCNMECSGLVDSNCNLRFCNQMSEDAYPIYEGDVIKPFALLNNRIQLAYYEKQITVMKKICSECPFYNRICNGGCYIQHPSISREDILQNTQLPITQTT